MLPDGVQPLVDRLRALLGVPACQLTIHCDADGLVQKVQPMITYTRPPKRVDSGKKCAQA